MVDAGGWTGLHYCAAASDGPSGDQLSSTISSLIQAGAQIDARDKKGMAPLELSVLSGDAETCRLLSQWNATVIDPFLL